MEAAVAAQRLGHKEVYTYRGGYPEWIFHGLEVTKP
jgi:3-mercaptopyruvate sulfurtransferase SseA